MLMILVQWTLHTNQNHLLQCHIGVRPAFVLLILSFQLRILEMTQIHQWREMNFSAHSLCFIDHLFLVSDFRQLPCWDFLQFFPIISPLLPLHLEFLTLEASEWICEQDCNESQNSSLLQWCDLDEVCVHLLLTLISCFRRHQQYKRFLSWVSQYCGGFLHCSLSVFCWPHDIMTISLLFSCKSPPGPCFSFRWPFL